MNKKFTLIAAIVCLAASTKAQVLLNEIYTDPGNGKNEFFELYNSSTSSTPTSMDGYTVMSYFEEGSDRGFYILDLPNLSVEPRGYFTGASALPFNYQGNLNSNAAQFSWNDPMLSSNFGYLRKWVDNGTNLLDGNKNYDLAPIPVGCNDFFSKRGGNGASYNAFIFKNGVLINAFFGGVGGSNTMPNFITSMPNIRIEQLTSTGSNVFNLNFNSFKNKPIEYVGQDAGSDNGFIRNLDGTCGTWTKSSADANHTPGFSNGSPIQSSGDVVVSAYLIRDGANGTAKIIYNVSSAPSNVFPIEMEVFVDNGTVFGELDAADTFVESKTENKLDDGPFTTFITHYTQNVLIVVKQPAGCLDKVMFRDIVGQSTLPLTITAWEGNKNGDRITLKWALAENELAAQFEVQRSNDGKNFSTVGLIFSTEIFGNQGYGFSEKIKAKGKILYRLKMIERNSHVDYTKTLLFDMKNDKQSNVLHVIGNPVINKLTLSYNASHINQTRLAIYNTMGHCVFTRTLLVTKGSNVWD
ncbi:MAG: hypothetical protein ABR503_05260, partial [Chitinophagaceae bacterium]